MRSSAPYCGDPSLPLGQFLGRDSAGGVPALFDGRRVGWSFNTRVAIRAGCDLLALGPGDEVLAPAYNCGSEIDPLLDAGLRVTLYPVGRDTEVDPDEVARRIGRRTRAVYVTHYFGVIQSGLAALRALCDAHGLRLIEDCALSLLSGEAPAEGRTGDIAVFSMSKFFPVFGGGALVVNAADIDAPDRLFDRPPPRGAVAKAAMRQGLSAVLGPARAQALVRGARARLASPDGSTASGAGAGSLPDIPDNYYFDPALRNVRISALAARPIGATGVAASIAARHAVWARYMTRLGDAPGARPLLASLPATACALNMPVVVAGRDALAAALQDRGIAATPWWAGYHRGIDWSDQPEATWLKEHVLALPIHPQLGAGHVDRIVATVRQLTD